MLTIHRHYVGVGMRVWCMAWHVGRVDVARHDIVCCHVHAMCGGCGVTSRAAHRAVGLHRAMCGAVTVAFAGVMGGQNVCMVHGMSRLVSS